MSLFDLDTSGSIEGDAQTSLRYVQETPMQTATGTSFGGSRVIFRWSQGTDEWFIPGKSYVRMRATMTDGGDNQLELADLIAPAMGFASNLFRGAELKLNNNEISRVEKNISEIDIVDKRLSKSKAWMDSVGATVNFYNADFTERLNDVSIDGFTTKIPRSRAMTKAEAGIPSTVAVTGVAATNLATFSGTGAGPNLSSWLRPGDQLTVGAQTWVVESLPAVGDTVLVAKMVAITTDVGVATTDWSFAVRQDGEYPSRRIQNFEVVWQPALGVFKLPHAIPGGGLFELELQPSATASYKLKAVESLTAKVVDTNFKLSVDEIYFYSCRTKGERVSNKTYYLDMEETRMIPFVPTNDAITTFKVPESTYAITVAFQDSGAGKATNYPVSKFVERESKELNLRRLQVRYAGYEKPQRIAQFEYSSAKDYMQARYFDTYAESGQYFERAGPESFDDWLTRGPIYHFTFPKDRTNKETDVEVEYEFANSTDYTNMRMLVFAHYRTLGKVQVVKDAVRAVDLRQM